jgi:hypothetical protein
MSILKNIQFFYQLGCNPLPADSKVKTPCGKWGVWQEKSIPEQLFEHQIRNGNFNNGYAIMTGELKRGPNKGKYLVCIDIDNRKGLEEFFSYLPLGCNNIDDLSRLTLVVQRQIAKQERAHIYLICSIPITKRSGIAGVNKTRLKDPNLPAIEVKSDSSTCMIGPGCLHEDGSIYEILGTQEPKVLEREESTVFEKALNRIYEKYGPGNDHNNDSSNSNLPQQLKIIAQFLAIGSTEYVIQKGTRDKTLLAFAESVLSRHYKSKDLSELKEFFMEVSLKLCEEQLPKSQLEKIWHQATEFILPKNMDKDNLGNRESEESAKAKGVSITYKHKTMDQL